MRETSVSNAELTYKHDPKCLNKPADAHHIVVRRSNARVLLNFLSLIVVGNLSYILLVKETSGGLLLWSFLLGIFMLRIFYLKPVKKETVLIMPTFGVQLETHYISGRTVRRFVPISKILKPVLQECVTPVTCYWCLSLILREEKELMLVFREVRPPMKMLVPIWKALCNATEEVQGSEDCG